MKKIALKVALLVVLLLSACGEDLLIDTQREAEAKSGAEQQNAAVDTEQAETAGNILEQEEPLSEEPIIDTETLAGNTPEQERAEVPTIPSDKGSRKKIKPSVLDIFNAQRAAWEAEHPDVYELSQAHRRSLSTIYGWANTIVVDEIRDILVTAPAMRPPGPREVEWTFLLLSSTISELYEKIDMLWKERPYTWTSFSISYDDQLHYPTYIQIRNINNSGDDYSAEITIQVLPDDAGSSPGQEGTNKPVPVTPDVGDSPPGTIPVIF